MNRRLQLAAMSLLAAGCAPPVPPSAAATPAVAEVSELTEHTDRIWGWFPGEYSNHEQVLEQKYRDQEPYRELRQIFLPVEMPRLGPRVLFVQQHVVGNPEPYRVRLYTLQPDPSRGAVRLDIYKPTDPAALTNLHLDPTQAATLRPETDFSLAEGCSVWWTPTEAGVEPSGYVGQTDADTCRVTSASTGETLVFSDTLLLTSERLHIQDVARSPTGELRFGNPDGDPHKLRKLAWYSGWSVVRKGGPDYDRAAPEWQVHKGLHLHSEGGRTPLIDADGSPMPYAVELARLTRAGSDTPVLKVTLYDTETDKSVAYAWTNPGAERIGVNLGWAQIGLVRESNTPHIGFDSNETSALVKELAARLTGTLSSSAQAAVDPDFRDIRLQSCEVDAPGLGATVLYVEQAVAEKLDAPYRQRLYLLEEVDDTTVRSSIYTLADPAAFTGLCARRERPFVHPSQAIERQGCAVDLTFSQGVFSGETDPKSCPSSLRGSTHATVAVQVTETGLDSWDRGWNDAQEQVWGSEKGPYAFRRQTTGDTTP